VVGAVCVDTTIGSGSLGNLNKSFTKFQTETVGSRDGHAPDAAGHYGGAPEVRTFGTAIKILARIRQALTRTLRPPNFALEGSPMSIIEPVISAATSWNFLALVAILASGLWVEAVIPRYRYDRAKEPISQRLRRNFSVGLVWLLVVLPIGITPVLLAASQISVWHRPPLMHGPVFVIADLVILDFVSYAVHHALHKSPYLWRYHMVHHLDQHLDMSSSFRTHFVELGLFSFATAATVLIVAMPLPSVMAWQTLAFFISLYHHHNVRVGGRFERLISRVFSTRTFHDIHHGREMKYTNSNYAFVLTIWDYLFRTYSTMDRPEGFSNGLDDHGDYSATALLLNPILRPGKPFRTSFKESDDQSTAAEFALAGRVIG
jgi:sterol desaturase/sphingolipid hydroxylase (fatty acid hydroxylase superfamily)